jgi:IclR family transcriptional regulator, acetate operon repressor
MFHNAELCRIMEFKRSLRQPGGRVQRSMSRVQSIERAFAVLGTLANGPSGVTEVAEQVGLPKSTVARLLGSLVREGAVEQEAGGSRYRLGSRLLTLAESSSPLSALRGAAHPVLVRLAGDLGEAAGLSIADGFDVHYIDQVDTTHQVGVRDWTGTRVPMHAVSSGLVLLAASPEVTIDAFLNRRLRRFTSRTVTAPATIRRRLARVRLDGHAWVHEEFAEGLNSVAAPVVDPAGATVGAIHVHGPAYRFPRSGDEREVAARVIEATGEVSRRLRAAGRAGES